MKLMADVKLKALITLTSYFYSPLTHVINNTNMKIHYIPFYFNSLLPSKVISWYTKYEVFAVEQWEPRVTNKQKRPRNIHAAQNPIFLFNISNAPNV